MSYKMAVRKAKKNNLKAAYKLRFSKTPLEVPLHKNFAVNRILQDKVQHNINDILFARLKIANNMINNLQSLSEPISEQQSVPGAEYRNIEQDYPPPSPQSPVGESKEENIVEATPFKYSDVLAKKKMQYELLYRKLFNRKPDGRKLSRWDADKYEESILLLQAYSNRPIEDQTQNIEDETGESISDTENRMLRFAEDENKTPVPNQPANKKIQIRRSARLGKTLKKS